VSILGLLVAALAAYRLHGTPLFSAALISAALNAAAAIARMALRASTGSDSRVATALGHVTAALGGFFLFVSFSIR